MAMYLQDPSIFDNILEAVLITDKAFSFVYVNSHFANLFGMAPRRLKNKDMSENLALKDWIQRPSINQEAYIQLPEAREIQVQVCVEPISMKVDDQQKDCWFFYIRDISVEGGLQVKYRAELKEKEIFIEQLDRKLFEVSFLLEISSLLNLHAEDKNIYQGCVEFIAKRFDAPRLALVQLNEQHQFKVLGAIGLPVEDAYWLRASEGKEPAVQKILAESTKTTGGYLLAQFNTLPSPQDQKLLSAAASQLIGRAEQDTLYFSSITDEKTKLYNARYLKTALENQIQRFNRWNEPFGLIVVDIDHFKKFNDTYGHQVGDDVLIHVATLIRLATRQTDIAARFGGEEFCVVAIKTDEPGLILLMERIRTQIAETAFKSEKHGELKVTVSLGGSLFPDHGADSEKLFNMADEALYESKKNGRNRSTLSKKK
jgi:diguanylate cyclase (GGDEF)-like protein/PAS domain S-box-containing protein